MHFVCCSCAPLIPHCLWLSSKFINLENDKQQLKIYFQASISSFNNLYWNYFGIHISLIFSSSRSTNKYCLILHSFISYVRAFIFKVNWFSSVTFTTVFSLKADCADALVAPLTVDTCRTILTWDVFAFVYIWNGNNNNIKNFLNVTKNIDLDA